MGKMSVSALVLGAVLCAGTLQAQTVGQDMKDAGHDTAHASRTVAHKTAHTTQHVARKTAHGTKVGARDTGHDTKVVGKDIGHGTKVGAEKTATGTRNVGRRIEDKQPVPNNPH